MGIIRKHKPSMYIIRSAQMVAYALEFLQGALIGVRQCGSGLPHELGMEHAEERANVPELAAQLHTVGRKHMRATVARDLILRGLNEAKVLARDLQAATAPSRHRGPLFFLRRTADPYHFRVIHKRAHETEKHISARYKRVRRLRHLPETLPVVLSPWASSSRPYLLKSEPASLSGGAMSPAAPAPTPPMEIANRRSYPPTGAAADGRAAY